MAIIKITEADRLKSKTAEAGWYGATITGCKMQGSKSQKSLNFITEFTLDEPLAGKELTIWFNTETNSGSILGALQMKPYSEFVKLIDTVEGKNAPEDYDTDDLIDRKVDVKVDVFIADGTPINIISSFLAAGMGRNQKAPF